MPHLDCHIFNDKICVAEAGLFKIGKWSIRNHQVEVDENFYFIIRSANVKKWNNYFVDYLFEGEGEAPLSRKEDVTVSNVVVKDDFDDSETILKLEKTFLRIENKSKNCTLNFNKVEICELMFGISHIYMSSLGLPPDHALCFSEMLSYFASFPVKEWEETKNKIKKMSISEYIELFEKIISNINLINVNSRQIYVSLKRFEQFFGVLFFFRIAKKVMG